MPLIKQADSIAWNDAQKETFEMVLNSSVVPLIPNINVGENERLSFHTTSEAGGIRVLTLRAVRLRYS